MVVVSSGIPVPVLLGTDIYGLKPVMVTSERHHSSTVGRNGSRPESVEDNQDLMRRMKSYQLEEILRVSAML